MPKTITVTIDEEGNTAVDLEGFHGQGCGKVLEEFRGGDPRRRADRLKLEYYGRNHSRQATQKTGGGQC